ncbi:hypothetical protein BP6252_03869 [Coleophoma cylindrospora]|uniref:Cupin type-2 domain-containing protein n=1 Tax=Coleophoma cylindrospora TaxID=1849047 RepID=A0A3D8S8R9_9HELO|nr:hypothetical protein BP6252_03869 [Coleophoma cylindrospora]
MVPSIAQLPDESVDVLVSGLRKSVDSKQNLEKVIRGKELVPLWNTGGPPTAPEPHTKHIPAVWRYEDTKSLLLRASEMVDAAEAERRAVLMINPGPRQSPFTLDTLLAAHQLILPGEQAICHRHTPFAVRFLIEGDQGYTAISGKKMYMVPGDLIITPMWNWHDHGNEGKANVIWLDGLNIPLFKPWPVDFTEHYDEQFGKTTHESKKVPDEECAEMKFPWSVMQSRLDSISGDHASCEYTLPDGKAISTTIGAYAHRIAPGKATKPCQETSNYVFQVHGGSGYVEVSSSKGDQNYTLKWSRGDAFVVPSWYRFTIHAAEGEPVYLFSFSDKPMLQNLGFWRSKE